MTLAYDPASAAATRDLLHLIGVTPNRTLGQNFLVNRGALDRIVEIAAVSETDHVLEIGPGLGALTCRLAARAGRVTAIEKDAQFIDFLRPQMPVGKVLFVAGDALQTEWGVLGLPDEGVKVVANLPYAISKPILRRFLEAWRTHLHSATLTVQREVADRIIARPSTGAYGPLALMTQLNGAARRVFDISPGSFWPPPNVTSSVVHIQIRQTPSVELSDERLFWRIINAAFGQRRKQLGNTLRAVVADKEQLAATLREVGIDPQRRGETLSLAEFAALANHLALASHALPGIVPPPAAQQ
ncbi:MAG TPA: 16S rRNA (adenine(1518)-N(6)/adenine(1519)-N(6))-dimethyltransferase RsmA [Abditibacteriaceae bacterium]|nr:16S rRNA (adenine(1518)-N(6)/adenine(1519)-N(6))-dimethyltransferase RsmA [Abditibacteriaceae bacterium]